MRSLVRGSSLGKLVILEHAKRAVGYGTSGRVYELIVIDDYWFQMDEVLREDTRYLRFVRQ